MNTTTTYPLFCWHRFLLPPPFSPLFLPPTFNPHSCPTTARPYIPSPRLLGLVRPSPSPCPGTPASNDPVFTIDSRWTEAQRLVVKNNILIYCRITGVILSLLTADSFTPFISDFLVKIVIRIYRKHN